MEVRGVEVVAEGHFEVVGELAKNVTCLLKSQHTRPKQKFATQWVAKTLVALNTTEIVSGWWASFGSYRLRLGKVAGRQAGPRQVSAQKIQNMKH